MSLADAGVGEVQQTHAVQQEQQTEYEGRRSSAATITSEFDSESADMGTAASADAAHGTQTTQPPPRKMSGSRPSPSPQDGSVLTGSPSSQTLASSASDQALAAAAHGSRGPDADSAMMRLLSRGIRIFNLNPKRGLEFIQANGLVHRVAGDDSGNARRVAIFLRHTRGLNKEQIGQVLGWDSAEALRVLRYYFVLFDFSVLGPTIRGLERGLRVVFECFKPPGEAQKIGRVVEAFARKFNEDNGLSEEEQQQQQVPADAQFHASTTELLAYSIIILNVDLHNPNNPRKMLRREFISNFRGLDNGRDLPAEELGALYDRIARQQIRHKVDRDELAGDLFTHPDKSGWLHKKGAGALSQWRPRWFILSESTLWYFRHSEDVEPQGFIPLENVYIRTCFDAQAARAGARMRRRPWSAGAPDALPPHREEAHEMERALSGGADEVELQQRHAAAAAVAARQTPQRPRSRLAQLRRSLSLRKPSSAASDEPPAAAAAPSRPRALLRRLSRARSASPGALLGGGASAAADGSAAAADGGIGLGVTAHGALPRTRDFWFELYSWDPRINVKSARLSRTGSITLGQHKTIKLRAHSRQELEQWVEVLNQKGRFSQNLQELTLRARSRVLPSRSSSSLGSASNAAANGGSIGRRTNSKLFRALFSGSGSSLEEGSALHRLARQSVSDDMEALSRQVNAAREQSTPPPIQEEDVGLAFEHPADTAFRDMNHEHS